MSKLVDVARNKHLQKKLLKYHDGSQQLEEMLTQEAMEQEQ
tara:strand:- start:888 stop:1010 length:123 start_codon:yes stop_codon:yes gene_type:complete